MKSACLHDNTLKFVKALLFRSLHETDVPTVFKVVRNKNVENFDH